MSHKLEYKTLCVQVVNKFVNKSLRQITLKSATFSVTIHMKLSESPILLKLLATANFI